MISNHDELIPLLPFNAPPKTLLISNTLPCNNANFKPQPTESILTMLQRQAWHENLYIKKNDLDKIYRYKHSDGSYKNDFDDLQFLTWVKTIEENTAICDMENPLLGKGVFVPPGKRLPKGTFIISSGIIKFNPTKEELETKVHCSALEDLNSPDKKIIGLIDPGNTGGILDLINHAPNENELANFTFDSPSIKMNVAVSNLIGKIKFYKGYSIMGVEVPVDIEGGETGAQLLWSYASPDEYLTHDFFTAVNQSILLFDNRDEHNGKTINIAHYNLKKITIFMDTGDLIPQKITTMARWEIMDNPPKSHISLPHVDTCLTKQLIALQASISYGFLQSYLNKNPNANRIIINIML